MDNVKINNVLELRNFYHKEALMKSNYFYHKTLKNKDGSPLKAKRNGKNKELKTRSDFKIPIKRGIKEFGYIDQDNYLDWTI